ncbi:MAG: hypothetical protein ACETWQ_20375, partial [Phycisphaerae bacterium]
VSASAGISLTVGINIRLYLIFVPCTWQIGQSNAHQLITDHSLYIEHVYSAKDESLQAPLEIFLFCPVSDCFS